MRKDSFDIPLKDLLEAGCHFGHQSRRWNPRMAEFIWLSRQGIHIFDLAKTALNLKKACLTVRDLVAEGGVIVFVGTKRQARAIVKKEAERVKMPYVVTRWLGGTITNWGQIKKSIDKLKDMIEKKKKGEYEKYTKKENVLIDREINRLTRFFGGLVSLDKIPEAIFVVDSKKEVACIKEAQNRKIKIFSITDSNSDPEGIDYVIPANDDAVKSVELVVSQFAKAVAEGKKLRKVKKTGRKKATLKH